MLPPSEPFFGGGHCPVTCAYLFPAQRDARVGTGSNPSVCTSSSCIELNTRDVLLKHLTSGGPDLELKGGGGAPWRPHTWGARGRGEALRHLEQGVRIFQGGKRTGMHLWHTISLDGGVQMRIEGNLDAKDEGDWGARVA